MAIVSVDIPQLSSDGIHFGGFSFEHTTSLQSSSRRCCFFSFEATALEEAIKQIKPSL